MNVSMREYFRTSLRFLVVTKMNPDENYSRIMILATTMDGLFNALVNGASRERIFSLWEAFGDAFNSTYSDKKEEEKHTK